MALNTERLEELASIIERQNPDTFNMAYWDCGSSACIGGWCERLYPDHGSAFEALTVDETGRIDDPILNLLFYPGEDRPGMTRRMSEAAWASTPAQAAKVIRNLITTGKVDWSIIL